MRVQNYVGCAENLHSFTPFLYPTLTRALAKGDLKKNLWIEHELEGNKNYFLKFFFSLHAPAFFGINLYFKLYFFSIFLLEQCAKRMM